MVQWMENFRRAIQMGFDAYCASLDPQILGPDLPAQLPYLTQHAAWREARSQLPAAPVRLMPSAAEGAPFWFLSGDGLKGSTSTDSLFTQLMNLPEGAFNSTTFIKLRGADRHDIRPLGDYHGYLARSLSAALPPGYTGNDYMEINPFGVGWWLTVSISSVVGAALLAALAAGLAVWCCLTRRPEPQPEEALVKDLLADEQVYLSKTGEGGGAPAGRCC